MAKKGLLIVDLQEGFAPSPLLVDRIRELSLNYPVIAMTRFSNQVGSLFRLVLGWNGDGGALCLDLPSATTLEKTGYGLTAEHLEILKDIGCTEWHICGLETDACVLACAFSLWDAGLCPVVLLDHCQSPLSDEVGKIIHRQFGQNQTTKNRGNFDHVQA
ncbi:isochorismatase family protein [Acidithiobacillus ferrooxidans]|uniref:Isochorismatase-like domain-containing protein n=1 Tax=Acidithiobacillus ferrooxidans (strain ATCC 23270 / DSM 14882 / CIP 104768 / NCIMB 8455) TaxID=243159 RepID=B7J880_ACIF2|nr:isochorismatase family protein [Acidithiobacillus ferrooxidans]ACK80478.1 conserved hypothetical protein [Acidithiobacillus ferrooxidans ATCC 23270]